MAQLVSDYTIYVPETDEPGACLVKARCIKIASAPENPRGAKVYNWCLNTVTGQWEPHSKGEPPPPTSTITIQTADDSDAAKKVLQELFDIGCAWAMQAIVICDDTFDEVLTFPGIETNSATPDNGYGFGVPGVDTGAAPPATTTYEGTWLGRKFTSNIIKDGVLQKINTEAGVLNAFLKKLVFCDVPTCGLGCSNTTPSNGCRTAYGILDDGTNPILAEYHITFDGVVSLVGTETVSVSNGIVDMTCLDGQIVITDGTCIFTKCGNLGFTKVVLPDEVPAGSIKALASAMGKSDHLYALFSTSGVLSSTNGRRWVVAMQDGFFPTAPQQTRIKAVGEVVVTVGEDSSLLISTNGGVTWSEKQIDASNPTDDVLDVGLDLPDLFNKRHAFLYVVTTDGTKMTIYFSNDDGNNWEARATFDDYPELLDTVQLDSAINGVFVHFSYDDHFHLNTNYACECEWQELNVEFACVSTKTATCKYDPDTVLMISDQVCTIFGVDDVYEVANQTAGVIPVSDNDRPGAGQTIDVTSIVIAAVTAGDDIAPPATLNAVAPGDGTITINPTAAHDDSVVTFTYKIDDTTPTTSSAITVTVIIGDPDPSLLVC